MFEALSGAQLIVLGLLILVTAFVLRRSLSRSRRSRNRDLLSEVRSEMDTAGQSATSRARQLEVRLHDFGREVEARVQTRMAQLDRLVIDADREILQLQQLLNRDEPHPPNAQPHSHVESSTELTTEQHQMIRSLRDAGYSCKEVAKLTTRSEREISEILLADLGNTSDQHEAA